MGGAVSMATASQGGKVAWIVPNYRNGRPLWRWIESTAGPLRKSGDCQINRSERTLEFPKVGGFLGIYSADSPDSIRGEAFNLVVLDEAARIAKDTWTDAIQPTLADESGDAILISTPKGRNWFWQEWARGQADGHDVASFTAPSAANPSPQIRRAAQMAKTRVSERTYRQEWLAEFVEDGGEVFRRVTDAATATPQERAIDGHQYVMGVDWGRTNDATVLTVIDATTREVVALDRFTQIDFSLQRGRLTALWQRFGGIIIPETNNFGLPVVEDLQRAGLPVQPFTTTNATKLALIDGLAMAFEQQELRILPDQTLISELQAYEQERLPSGLVRFSAPDGMHDDMVMSLALAWSGAKDSGPLFAWGGEDND